MKSPAGGRDTRRKPSESRPVKPHNVDEQSTNLCRGEKTLWSFTAACCCVMVAYAECSWES